MSDVLLHVDYEIARKLFAERVGDSGEEALRKHLYRNEIRAFADQIDTTWYSNYGPGNHADHGETVHRGPVAEARFWLIAKPAGNDRNTLTATIEDDEFGTYWREIRLTGVHLVKEDIDQILTSKQPARRGRRPQVGEEFLIEIIRIANAPDGLPETQAELERHMLQWCQDVGNPLGESSVRERISPIYQTLGLGRK